MRKPSLWVALLLVMLAVAPVSAMTTAPDPNVSSGTLTIAGQEIGFYSQGAPVTLGNTGDYKWWYGCSPTSAGMMVGYYDRNGYGGSDYSNLVPGGVAEANTFGAGPYLVNSIIASPGHIADFYKTPPGYNGSLDDNPSPWHAFNCLADFMGSSQDAVGNTNGMTTFWYWLNGAPFTPADALSTGVWNKDGMYGIKEYVNYAGYNVKGLYTQSIYSPGAPSGFTYSQYMAEIDAGRPVLIQVEGHTMLGYGYDAAANNSVCVYDTWAPNGQNPGVMTWGGSYSGMQQWGVEVLELEPSSSGVVPEPMTLTCGLIGLACIGGYLKRRRAAA